MKTFVTSLTLCIASMTMAQTENTTEIIDVQKEKIEDIQTVIVELSKDLTATFDGSLNENNPKLQELVVVLDRLSENNKLQEALTHLVDQLTAIQESGKTRYEISISTEDSAELKDLNLVQIQKEIMELGTALEESDILKDLLKAVESSELSTVLRKKIIITKD